MYRCWCWRIACLCSHCNMQQLSPTPRTADTPPTGLWGVCLQLIAGSYFTGPGVNPAISFSWYHHYQGLDLQQHLWLYWAAPFVGALTAGLAYRMAGTRAAAAAAAKPAAKARPKAAASPKKPAKQAQAAVKGTPKKAAKDD